MDSGVRVWGCQEERSLIVSWKESMERGERKGCYNGEGSGDEGRYRRSKAFERYQSLWTSSRRRCQILLLLEVRDSAKRWLRGFIFPSEGWWFEPLRSNDQGEKQTNPEYVKTKINRIWLAVAVRSEKPDRLTLGLIWVSERSVTALEVGEMSKESNDSPPLKSKWTD